jgi:hypothetical protein
VHPSSLWKSGCGANKVDPAVLVARVEKDAGLVVAVAVEDPLQSHHHHHHAYEEEDAETAIVPTASSASTMWNYSSSSSSLDPALTDSNVHADNNVPLGADDDNSATAAAAAATAIAGDEGKDEDNRSVSSSASTAAYFEPSDLNPRDWAGVMGDHAPTLALGLVAVVAVVLHPVLFVAGTLAAATGAAAAAATTTVASSSTTDAEVNDEEEEVEPAASSSSSWLLGWHFLESICLRASNSATLSDLGPTSLVATEQQGTVFVDQGSMSRHEAAQAPLTLGSGERSLADGELTAVKVGNGEAHDNHRDEEDEDPRKKEKADEEEMKHAAFVATYYPPLDCPIVADQVLHGLSALEFFKVFLDDAAPYNFIQFQKKRGDVDIVYRPWEPIVPGPAEVSFRPEEGDGNDNKGQHHLANRPVPTPMFPVNAADRPTSLSLSPHAPNAMAYQQRIVTFKAKTNAIFGPAYAPTTKTQRFALLSKRWAVLESRTELSDIPFSDRFYVAERWIVHATKAPPQAHDGGSGDVDACNDVTRTASYSCRISASCQAVFKKPCGGALEGQIRSKSHSTLLEVATAWCAMAREALRLAEEAKLARLKQQQQHHHPERPITGNEQPMPSTGHINDLADKSAEGEAVEVEHCDYLVHAKALRRSESEPNLLHGSFFRARTRSSAQQLQLRNSRSSALRQSMNVLARSKPSLELRRERKGTAMW